MVLSPGIEPGTSALSERCSPQLSYDNMGSRPDSNRCDDAENVAAWPLADESDGTP